MIKPRIDYSIVRRFVRKEKMKLRKMVVLLSLLLAFPGCAQPAPGGGEQNGRPAETGGPVTVSLPAPMLRSDVSVEEALANRRSVREYAAAPLTLDEAGQLLWAAQGITGAGGARSAPSAGALYPLEVYLVVGEVEGLAAGVYRYAPEAHGLVMVKNEDVREALAAAAANQDWVAEGAVVIVISAVYERTTLRYGERGIRYVHMEAGHAAQNLYLQAEALGLGTVVVGAFYDQQVRDIIMMPDEEVPLYIIPVGRI